MLSKRTAGNNEMVVGNVCHCIPSGCCDCHNGIVWMAIGALLNHAPYVIVRWVNLGEAGGISRG